nr:Dihydrofolate reductase [uncultured bacterium]AIA15101.1 Dihydrofolate reductase [uncultured bacterium]
MIVAQAAGRVIGKSNDLPWYLPADLKRFRILTTGHRVVMGRKTYESILARLGKPLPDRENIVISRSLTAPGCVNVRSLDEALALGHDDEIFILGGASIYEQALPHTQRIYLTQVMAEIEGDTFFPELKSSEWHEVSREDHPADDKNLYAYSFRVLERV